MHRGRALLRGSAAQESGASPRRSARRGWGSAASGLPEPSLLLLLCLLVPMPSDPWQCFLLILDPGGWRE